MAKLPNPFQLQRRVAELEAEVQECRAVNLRVAELTDLVTELLVPLVSADPHLPEEARARMQAVIDRYHESL